ncbi:galactoside 2-alpha-L-fucosyltransferase 2 [Xenopus tropicalis]|uniref:L-Fucosyltransferase n=1 Tax=Xenopus tropicalis TaxID=8364 RepID=F6U6D7_XENTR|nr:galactoside 2-alpha-L-fucosyltransferase 2 [Xenopus tropicalis]
MNSKNIFGVIVIISLSISSYIYYSNSKEERQTLSINNYTHIEYSDDHSKEHLITNQLSAGMWTAEPLGRLGNLMMEYATLYALAKLNGHQAYLVPKMHEQLSQMFRITLPVLHSEVAQRIKWKIVKIHQWMYPEYKHIQGDYVKLSGNPCSWTFFHHIQEEILREFTFHDFIAAETNAYLYKVQGDRKNVTFIGVHVRRGDYVKLMPGRQAVVGDEAYFKEAMDYFRAKYENPLFIITSNGMDWCKENIDNSTGDVHFTGDGKEGSPIRDFSLLAHCNHTIMSIGTFGFWAGYLVGGETVYLANFSLPESHSYKTFQFETFYLPDWIGIPADLSSLRKKTP